MKGTHPSETANNTEIPLEKRAALLTLLTDEDPEVFHKVREIIVSGGPQVSEWLRPHTLSPDPILRRRALSIVRQFERHAADNAFVVFCLASGKGLDLEKGVLLLSKTQYPEVNTEGYSALLDTFAAELGEKLALRGPNQVLSTVAQYVFDQLGFSGNSEHYYEPDNSYFSRVMDRRTGNPINLCVLYLLLAKRLRLPVAGIGLPGHFVCRYQTSALEVYVDVFNKGKLMSKADCMQYLLSTHFGITDDLLSPAAPRRILFRICSNLHHIYVQMNDAAEATRLRRYMVALSG